MAAHRLGGETGEPTWSDLLPAAGFDLDYGTAKKILTSTDWFTSEECDYLASVLSSEAHSMREADEITLEPDSVEYARFMFVSDPDWQSLLALLQETYAYMEGRIDPPSSLNQMDLDSLISKSRNEEMILAVEAGELLGCLFATKKGGAFYLAKIAVSKSRQGQGTRARQ